jgi:hypothetical protein
MIKIIYFNLYKIFLQYDKTLEIVWLSAYDHNWYYELMIIIGTIEFYFITQYDKKKTQSNS